VEAKLKFCMYHITATNRRTFIPILLKQFSTHMTRMTIK